MPSDIPTSLGKPRALVVQDPSQHLRAMARLTLLDLGFCVREAGRGVEAVSLARLWEPQIILLDSQLRDASGREVESWLRVQPLLRNVPIVLLGGAGPMRHNARTVPVRLPCTQTHLKQCIARAMAQPNTAGEAS